MSYMIRESNPEPHAFGRRPVEPSPLAPMFDLVCAQHDIQHGLTKFNHPWTSGQVERMNRIIKDAPVRRFCYEAHESLRTHVAIFLAAYNFAKPVKSLAGFTPFERICLLWIQARTIQTQPLHGMVGLNV